MALLEKEIHFDVIFISLYNKPVWYTELVPSKLVPAVSIRGRVVWESLDILKARIVLEMLQISHRQPSCNLQCYK